MSEDRDTTISEQVRIKIVKEYVEPMYLEDVVELIDGKKCWRRTGQIFETISKAFVAIGSIVSFAAGIYDYPTLSYISGSISVISLATLQFSSFSYNENKKQSNELNVLLKKLNLDTVPVLERDANTVLARQSNGVGDTVIRQPEKDEIIEEMRTQLIELNRLNVSLQKESKNKEYLMIYNKYADVIKSRFTSLINGVNNKYNNGCVDKCEVCSLVRTCPIECDFCESCIIREPYLELIQSLHEVKKSKNLEAVKEAIRDLEHPQFSSLLSVTGCWKCEICGYNNKYNNNECRGCLLKEINKVIVIELKKIIGL